MTTILTALLLVLPLAGMIPAHRAHAAVAAPVHYENYDYR